MTVAIKFELQNFNKLHRQLGPEIVEKALNIAIGRTAKKVRTKVSVAIRKRYNIKARDINQAVRIRRYRSSRYARMLTYSGRPIPLDRFSPSAKIIRTGAGKRRGVSVRIRKDRGRKVVRGAFLADIHGKKIFKRRGSSRNPIKRLFAISIPQMADDGNAIAEANSTVRRELPIEFNRAMQLQINRAR